MKNKLKKLGRYPERVIHFAVTRRLVGDSWKSIADDIGRRFGIVPPTEHRMREWVKIWGKVQNVKQVYTTVSRNPENVKTAFYLPTMHFSRTLRAEIATGLNPPKETAEVGTLNWATEMLCMICSAVGPVVMEKAIEDFLHEAKEGNPLIPDQDQENIDPAIPPRVKYNG